MSKVRMGKFQVSRVMLEEHLAEVQQIFAFLKIVPVRAEFVYDRRVVEYTAYGDFPEIEELSVPPQYLIHVTATDGVFESAEAKLMEDYE